jgi:hypothetical protein
VNHGGPFEGDGVFRPRIGRRSRRDRDLVPSFNIRLARTAQKTGQASRGRRSRIQPGRIAVRAPHALSRRCVIKARYVPTTGDGRKLAARHLVLLCHKRPQQGQHGSVRASARAMRARSVAIDAGLWRSGRTGTSPRAETCG